MGYFSDIYSQLSQLYFQLVGVGWVGGVNTFAKHYSHMCITQHSLSDPRV